MDQVSSPLLIFDLTVPLAATLLRLAWIDLQTFRLPDAYTIPLIVAGLGLALLIPQPDLVDRLIGTAAGFLSLAVIGEVHFRRTGVEGLGLGDAKLFAAAGAWLGWQALPLVVLIASVIGLIHAVTRGKGPQGGIAFGPMLALGFLACWIAQGFQPGAFIFLEQ